MQTKQIWKTASKTRHHPPWEAFCVDLIGPYILKGKDKTVVDFMCITMIDLATSWFKIAELLISGHVIDISMGTKAHGYKGAQGQRHTYPTERTVL